MRQSASGGVFRACNLYDFKWTNVFFLSLKVGAQFSSLLYVLSSAVGLGRCRVCAFDFFGWGPRVLGGVWLAGGFLFGWEPLDFYRD